jgi:hypothetical protein
MKTPELKVITAPPDLCDSNELALAGSRLAASKFLGIEDPANVTTIDTLRVFFGSEPVFCISKSRTLAVAALKDEARESGRKVPTLGEIFEFKRLKVYRPLVMAERLKKSE